MKHQKVDKFGYFYEVTPKQYMAKKLGRPRKEKRLCAYEDCETAITSQSLSGFCATHRPSLKNKFGFKVKQIANPYLILGTLCKTPKCKNKTPSDLGLCGFCLLKYKFRVKKNNPKAPFKTGGLKELEAIVALEKKLSQRKSPQQEALPLR